MAEMHNDVNLWMGLLPDTIQLVIGLFLTVKAGKIAGLLMREGEREQG
ncbi:MAG: hypothetical protein QMD53_06110 [Actinomycetota bacterium]|nr:hypothetical protein [Actinomycetota bacterium]